MTRSPRTSLGMTLIEVMISLAVLGMIVVSVWSSFNGTVRGMETSEEVQKRYGIIRNGLARLTSEISMTYLSYNRPPDDPLHYTYFEGRNELGNDSLTFSSFAHLRVRKDANESDQSIIQYFVAPDPEDGQRSHLYRRESRHLVGLKVEDLADYYPAYVVIEDVLEFELKYWDVRQLEWLDEWRTTKVDMQPDRIPERVRIKIVVRDVDGDPLEFHTQAVTMMLERIDLGKQWAQTS